MKMKSVLMAAIGGAFACFGATEVRPAAPGFVKVEWSEREGERWTIEGLADLETGRPMAKDTVFAIMSNTKPVTSVLVLTLVEEGVLDLDDPVARYFPELGTLKYKGEVPARPITLRHLLTHLSGLPYQASAPDRKGDRMPYLEHVRYAAEHALRSEPGKAYQYCGLGFQIMGAVIEKATGRKVVDLMKERIFDPLEMTETTFYPDDGLLARVATPYYHPPTGGEPMRWWFDERWTAPVGSRERTALLSSGLFSSVRDYLKFSQMMARKGLGLNGRRILSERTFDDYILTRQTPPGDKVDASFDVHFNAAHTAGGKGGLLATYAEWNWENRSCTVSFQAKSPYAPAGVKSAIDATGFGGKPPSFAVTDVRVAGGTAACRVSNEEDRHGIRHVELTVNGASVETLKVELAIGESKVVSFRTEIRPDDKVAIRLVP